MARVVVPDVAHHVTQRGNRRGDVFFSDADKRHLLGLLGEYPQDCGLEILACCLVTNHVHLAAVPERENSLARTLKPVNLRYAQYVNRVQGWCGRLRQERFFSCPMDAGHTLMAVRCVEQNPVRAGLASRAEECYLSSAAGHTGRRVDPLVSDRLDLLSVVGNWAEWLTEDEDADRLARLRMHTRTGRPLGADTFVSQMEQLTHRELRPRPRGRPHRHGGNAQ